MAWWLLPAIGAAVGALTNLNHPEQTWKNALLGAGLGFGASQIPGVTKGASSLLGISGNSTVPLETATGTATKLNVPAMDKFMALTGNPATDMKMLSPAGGGVFNYFKSPQYLMGASSLFNQMNGQPQPNPNSNMVLGGGMQPQPQPQGQPRPQQPVDSGIYGTNFQSPWRKFKLGLDTTMNAIDRYYPPMWRGRY